MSATFLLISSLTAQTYRSEYLPSDGMTGFGASIAMMGDEVYVGRPGEMSMFPMPATRAGGVHVFEIRMGGEWTETGVLSAPDGVPGDGFGMSVSVAGNLMAVGAPNVGGGRGAVHLFERGAGGWNHVAIFESTDGDANDRLGQALAISGSFVFAGAPGRSDGAGVVLVLERVGTRLNHVSTLPSGTPETNNQFGSAIAVDGDRVIVGAPGPASLSMLGLVGSPRPGAAYLFRRGSGPAGWEQEAVLTSDAQGIAALGQAVAFLGQAVAVSAPLSGGGAGGVHLFEQDSSGVWAMTQVITPTSPSPGSLFGFSLAASEEDLLVGAGMIVFQGGAIAMQDNRAIVGAPGADFFQGAGVLFERGDGTGDWSEQSTLVDDLPGFDAVAGGQVDCEEGAARVFNCDEVDLVAFIPVKELGGARGITVNDVWGWTDSLTGNEYAIVGRSDGTTFIDVSNPENPVYLGVLPLTEGATINIWRDIKVYKNHAFIVADAAGAHGVQIFDMTQLRDLHDLPVTFEETAHYDGIFSAHNIVINEQTGFAYTVGSSGGGETCGGALHMIDVRNPTQPTFAGCFSDPTTGNASTGYSHDAQCISYRGPDLEYTGREICFGSNETALSIADVTDKENPVAISSGSYPSVAYAHQGWVTEDHRHFFMNDELDELTGGAPRTRTLVWDVEDLDDPVLLMEYLGETQASDHNLYIRGDYMYQSNYVSGLRIVDISDPGNPTEVGHFDTVPFGEDAPGFSGSWSNFPFFDSEMIIVTSMWEGVFILKKRDTRPIP